MPTRLAIALLLFATAPCFAADKGNERPDREMLRMMEFLREMEMLKQIEMMRELKRVEPVSGSATGQPAPRSSPGKKKEATK